MQRSFHSDRIKRILEQAPRRSLLKALVQVQRDSDFDKPFIGICNSPEAATRGAALIQPGDRIRVDIKENPLFYQCIKRSGTAYAMATSWPAWLSRTENRSFTHR